MAEIPVGERKTSDYDAFFKDTETDLTYRRVRDHKAIELLQEILATIEDSASGPIVHLANQSSTIPGVDVSIISATVPASTERYLAKIDVVCRQEGKCEIKKNGSLIGSMRTSAAMPNASFMWLPRYMLQSGDQIDVLFKARTGSPISDVEGYLMAFDKPT